MDGVVRYYNRERLENRTTKKRKKWSTEEQQALKLYRTFGGSEVYRNLVVVKEDWCCVKLMKEYENRVLIKLQTKFSPPPVWRRKPVLPSFV